MILEPCVAGVYSLADCAKPERQIMNKMLLILLIFLFCFPVQGYDKFQKFTRKYYIKYTADTRSRTISVGLNLVELKKYKSIQPDSLIYNQIMSYSEDEPFGDSHGRSTNAHETVHGINNKLRNRYKIILKKNVNGFYAGEGHGIIVENPPITIRDIIPYIPNVVRGYRFQLYFYEQLGAWNDVPTYPMDEWTSYIAGAETAVDDHKNKIDTEKADSVSGSLEFSIYCTALAMAVKDKCPDFWENNKQFRYAIKYFLIKSERVFFDGNELFPSSKQENLLLMLREHEHTAPMRKFLLEEFEGIFVD